MTLSPDEMLEAIKRGLAENNARFHPKVIVSGWGAIRSCRRLVHRHFVAGHAWAIGSVQAERVNVF
jgi:hypothetical protein